MKKETLNVQRRTLIIRWDGIDRIKEAAVHYGSPNKADTTPNVQRSTPNVQRKTNARFDLEDRLLAFSARIIQLVDALPNTRAANHLAGQLLRSGTSPYGNHGDVEATESRKDFVHKLKVCLKELKETRRWLRLINKAKMLPTQKMVSILDETEELIRIFFTSIRTAEKNSR
ncbi:MAG TPA: four helix bundle protein [Chthoniobacterales bacterium]|nr:four helix bundle protein [Chthoniobacterales bacterium]